MILKSSKLLNCYRKIKLWNKRVIFWIYVLSTYIDNFAFSHFFQKRIQNDFSYKKNDIKNSYIICEKVWWVLGVHNKAPK